MTNSQMYREVHEIPQAVARLLDKGMDAIRHAADAARHRDPAYIATVARGSSDHACTYLKYAAELTLGLPVASSPAPERSSPFSRPRAVCSPGCSASPSRPCSTRRCVASEARLHSRP